MPRTIIEYRSLYKESGSFLTDDLKLKSEVVCNLHHYVEISQETIELGNDQCKNIDVIVIYVECVNEV